MRIFTSIEQLIGKTPLLRLSKVNEEICSRATILVKLESFNAGGSVKDRAALALIEDAEARGLLLPGGTIIEPTSGNTGVSLAMLAMRRGYRVILVMPDTMSAERRALLCAYGARLELTDGKRGMQGAIDRAQEIALQTPGSYIPGQFVNPANPRAHYETTGPEIWDDTQGAVDVFVAGVGTGGTISGVGAYLKEKKPSVRLIAVEPADSPVLSQGRSGAHTIQGIGAGFVPNTLNLPLIDEVMPVGGEDAFMTGRALARTEGILAGISSGAAVWAALELAKREENAAKTIVALLPDNGERYLSTPMFRE